MEIQSSRFGSVTIPEEDVILFTQPLLGFGRHRKYVLVEEKPDSLVRWLQSLDDPDLAFLVINPLTVLPDYEITLHPDDLKDLEIQQAEEAQLLTLVTVSGNEVRTNLRAPIILNPAAHKAKQVVLQETDYPIRYSISPPEEGANQADARSHT